MNTNKTFNLIMAFVFSFSLLGMPAHVSAQEPNPTFAAHLPGNQVHAYNWTAGSTLNLTIDDPEITGSPDFQATQIVPNNDLYGNTWTVFELQSFKLKPGQTMIITDSITTKTHVIRTVAVASVNPDTDIITGTAEPNTAVGINAHYNPGGDYVHRNIVADGDGNWSVNLSIPGPNPGEERTYDIVTGSWGTAFQWNDDNDSTFYEWRVLNPIIHAGPNQGFVYAHNWPEGTAIHMTVARAGSTIYTSDATVGPCGDGNPGSGPCGPNDAYFDLGYFDLGATQFDLQPSDVITLTGEGITRSMIVSALQVTDINTSTDTLTGMADIGRDISVGVCNNGPSLTVTPDSSGHWTANFAPFDIVPGACGGATQDDGNGNYTQQGWVMDNPNFNVRANNDQVEARAKNNQVYFSQWRIGDTLTLSIDNPITTAKNPDYIATQTASLDPHISSQIDSGQIYASFNLSGLYDIQIGDLISVSNGSMTKTTVVSNLAITAVHLDIDRVDGTVEPNQTLNVWTCWQNEPCISRDETANQNGHWMTNFAVPGEQDWEQATADLRAGSWIDSSVSDEDGDSTMFGWYVDIPNIEANTGDDSVVARGWSNGTPLTLTIDDPSNGPGVDKTVYATMGPSSWDSNDIAADFTPMLEDFDLKPGYILKVTDGTTQATYVPTNLTVTGFDLDADTISGIALPGVEVQVWVGTSGPHVLRYVTSDALTGNWTVDYGHPGQRDDEQQLVDLQPGSVGFVKEFDVNSNATHTDWQVPNIRIFVEPNEDNVYAWGWPTGTLLTLTIDDPATTSQTPDYTTTQVASGTEDWEHGFWLGGIFDIQPGFVVTVSGGGHIKQHIVTHLTITNINIDADTVSGTGYPGSYVHVGTVCNENGCANRNITVDADENWLANFSIPESGNPDAGMVFDLRPGLGSSVYEHDADNDSTKVNWNVPIDTTPPTIAWIGNIHDGDSFSFGFIPTEPTCIAADSQSGVDGSCTIAGYATTIGTHTPIATAKDKAGNQTTESRIYTVSGWMLKGFYQPVDMNGVYNIAKGGSTVPLKFEIFAGYTELTDVAKVKTLTYAQTSCDANAVTDEIETTATGDTSLRYAGGQFIYNWKTPKTAGKCYRVTMTTMDGSSLAAYFKLK